jgi:hypothetical protein
MKVIKLTESDLTRIVKQVIIENDRKEYLLKFAEENGWPSLLNYVGGFDNLVNVLFDGDVMTYYDKTGFTPVKITDDGMNMYIDDLIMSSLNLPIVTRGRYEEVFLGDFTWTSSGSDYKFSANGRSFISQVNGQKLWRVVGSSGDYGFGYAFITKRNSIGKRGRMQIFKQIISKYDLQKYL